MNLVAVFSMACCLLVSGCTTTSSEPKTTATHRPRFEFSVEDQKERHRFVLRLRSTDQRTLCVEVERWPNKAGRLHFGSTWAFVASDGKIFPGGEENFGYCLEDVGQPCYRRVNPGGVLEGFVEYSEFGNPRAIAKLANKRLHLPIDPVFCKKKRAPSTER